jgi:hypothetical protein
MDKEIAKIGEIITNLKSLTVTNKTNIQTQLDGLTGRRLKNYRAVAKHNQIPTSAYLMAPNFSFFKRKGTVDIGGYCLGTKQNKDGPGELEQRLDPKAVEDLYFLHCTTDIVQCLVTHFNTAARQVVAPVDGKTIMDYTTSYEDFYKIFTALIPALEEIRLMDLELELEDLLSALEKKAQDLKANPETFKEFEEFCATVELFKYYKVIYLHQQKEFDKQCTNLSIEEIQRLSEKIQRDNLCPNLIEAWAKKSYELLIRDIWNMAQYTYRALEAIYKHNDPIDLELSYMNNTDIKQPTQVKILVGRIDMHFTNSQPLDFRKRHAVDSVLQDKLHEDEFLHHQFAGQYLYRFKTEIDTAVAQKHIEREKSFHIFNAKHGIRREYTADQVWSKEQVDQITRIKLNSIAKKNFQLNTTYNPETFTKEFEDVAIKYLADLERFTDTTLKKIEGIKLVVYKHLKQSSTFNKAVSLTARKNWIRNIFQSLKHKTLERAQELQLNNKQFFEMKLLREMENIYLNGVVCCDVLAELRLLERYYGMYQAAKLLKDNQHLESHIHGVKDMYEVVSKVAFFKDETREKKVGVAEAGFHMTPSTMDDIETKLLYIISTRYSALQYHIMGVDYKVRSWSMTNPALYFNIPELEELLIIVKIKLDNINTSSKMGSDLGESSIKKTLH